VRVLVCAKWVGTLGEDVEYSDDGRSVDPDYLDYALNEWDTSAIEEALRLRDAADGGEVIVATVGNRETDNALVLGLAMGADRAVRVPFEDPAADPLTIARLLATVVQVEQPDLVFCGAQSGDLAQGATGAALAGLLGIPCTTVVVKVDVDSAGHRAVVQRELEGGLVEIVELPLPAVLTIQTGINEPRYVTMRAVQQAQRREIQLIESDTVEAKGGGYQVRSLAIPERRRAEIIAGDAKTIARRISELIRETRE